MRSCAIGVGQQQLSAVEPCVQSDRPAGGLIDMRLDGLVERVCEWLLRGETFGPVVGKKLPGS